MPTAELFIADNYRSSLNEKGNLFLIFITTNIIILVVLYKIFFPNYVQLLIKLSFMELLIATALVIDGEVKVAGKMTGEEEIA